MQSRHVLIIDGWHPPHLSAVRGRHWSREHKAKRLAAEILAAEAHRQGAPKATGRRRVRLKLTGWARCGLPDADAFDKLLLDSRAGPRPTRGVVFTRRLAG
jgi:hypothetical protein